MKFAVAIPVYNEERHLEKVLREVRRYCNNLIVIDDGSTDATREILTRQRDLTVLTHAHNLGYGAALIRAFRHFLTREEEILVTMDCDGQHEPARIPVLVEAIHDADIVSGSRYLREFKKISIPTPADRRQINQIITAELNHRLGLDLTDAFCGFKAYRATALGQLHLTEHGWGMPLQVWVQAARLGLRIKEVGVPRIYLDSSRAFGGVLNDPEQRLAYYRQVLEKALSQHSGGRFPITDWQNSEPRGSRR